MAVNLVFQQPATSGSPVTLVFGGEGSAVEPVDTSVRVLAVMAPMVGTGHIAQGTTVSISAVMAPMVGAGQVLYSSRTSRPVVNRVESHFQHADQLEVGTRASWHDAVGSPVATGVRFQDATPLGLERAFRWQDGVRVRQAREVRYQAALRLDAQRTNFRYQDGVAVHLAREARYRDALMLQALANEMRFQQAVRVRNTAAVRYQDAIAQSLWVGSSFGHGTPLRLDRSTRYQDAMVPPPGMYAGPVVPEEDPCYLPPLGTAVQLVFKEGLSGTNLVFVCETHPINPPGPTETIVVPIKKVYVVLNSASLRRVTGNIQIPTFGMSLSLDRDSWTWSFSASVPGEALSALQPDTDGTPPIVEMMINGVPYLLVVEGIRRSRTFGRSSLSLSGRGTNALLDAPYAPIQSFGNASARTAQQLMADVLTENGVPLPDWTIDWNLTDWNVPGGIWTHQGSYISALNNIVNAAGGYLQPNASNKTLRALLAYPVVPWDWASVTPDYELPSAITTTENIEWADKAEYNRVFVSGVNAGVLGQYTRTGTDGGLVAPMVTDALITEAAAARQRGRAIIGDTGRQANVSLRLPVLPATGLILPGKFVKYTDEGTDRMGLVRSMSVEVGLPEIMQTIALETHL